MKLGNILNAAQFEIQNPVFHNLASDPSTPKLGQWYYNTTTNRMRYWSGSTGTGSGWIEVNPSTIQNIQLTGQITGVWSGGIIPTVATKDLILQQTSSFNPDPDSFILYYDVGGDELAKFNFDDLQTWINGFIPSDSTLAADSLLGDTRVVLTSGATYTAVRIGGTANEVEVALDGGVANRIIIGLPNSVVIPTLSVTNLTVNGVPYAPYTHPTYSAITLSGSGLQFVQALQTDTIGSAVSASLGTIPSASTTVVGVMRFATAGEITAGTAGVAVQASQLSGFQAGWGFSSVLTGGGGVYPVIHNLGTTAVAVECFDQATGETIYPVVVRTSTSIVTVTLGTGAPTNVVALIRRVV